MTNLTSLSIFAGTGRCNANCSHCAGKVHRQYASKKDGVVDEFLINKTLKECYNQGARYLSISSSGEPTLSPISVTKTLELTNNLKKESIIYNPINLYSNGIRIGNDKNFCETYLPLWKNLGLTTIYLTVHDIGEKKNAEIYGIKNYPSLELILSRIHGANISVRANLMLTKKTINTCEKFISTVNYLKKIGVGAISAWPIRDDNDKVSPELSPPEEEMDKMDNWIKEQNRFKEQNKFKIKLLRENNQIVYSTGQKLTLFPDGTLSNTWCNN